MYLRASSPKHGYKWIALSFFSLSFYTAAEVGSSSTTHAAANRSRKCGIYWWLQMSKISKTIALARFLGAHAVFCSLRITTLTFFKCRRQQCSNAYTKESNLNGDNAMQKAWRRLSTIVLHIHTGWIRETRRGGYKKNWWKIIIGKQGSGRTLVRINYT